MQTQLQRSKHDPSETRCKLTLLILFLLGAALILGGFWGIRQYQQSGFDQEVGYRYIQKLSGEVESLYTQSIQPVMARLTDAERESLTLEAAALLKENWTAAVKADQSARTDEMLAGLEGDKLQQKTMELLSITYSLNGPKVASAEKKLLAQWTDAERDQNREALLRAVLDENAPVPQAAASAVGELTGSERAAALMQLFLVSANAQNEPLPTDHVNGLKKAARNAEARISAYEMTADGSVTLLSQVLISHSRTAILLGILLALDIALLFLMLYKDHSWHLDFKWAIILLIVDFMLVFQVLPMVYLIIKAFFPEGSFTFDVFQRLYTYQMNLGALKNTLIAATVTMVLGTLIAFPLAWLVGRTNLFGKKFFRSLFVLTYMVPPYVGAMAWLRLLNPNVGTMNQFFRMIFGLGDTPGPLNIYTLGGLIWVLTTFYYPYAFITISRAMEKMDPSLEEASRISGASPLLTVFRVTLPMMTPSLIAGALLVFVAAMSCYGIPSIIGAPGKVHTVTTRIIEYNGLGAQGISDATGLAVFLMALAILILYLSDFVVARKQYITVSGKSTRPNIVDLGKWRVPLTVLVSLFATIVVLIPFATILTTSFKIDVGKSLFDSENFTLTQWQTIFSRSETMSCLKNSLIFGVVTATVGIVVACTMSYLLQRTKIRGRKLPDFLITLGSGTPSVVIALGLIMTMKGDFGVNIYNTAYIMIVAYLIKYLMMGMRTVVSAMSQIHVSLEECSQISGASWTRTMLKITGPLIFPSIAAGWFLIFIPSFYELSMTTLLYSNSTKTIGFQLYEYWTFTSQPQSCAMAFGILMIVVVLNFLLNKLTKGEFSI
ncbi:MAG: iron ABC transporter permease [Eubacteriales bacterium]|nr:iron ABC transporter permease [Eubacteriales bacterium]